MDYYYTIDKPSVAEFKDRGSRFIGYAFNIETVDDFKNRLADIKKEHSKATHHCFAYRLGLDGNNFRVSDDGEPSGSAGRPILAQIDSRELTNTLVIVVRYFGGTLLGVPGLINAYRTAASLALQTTPVSQKPVQINYTLHFDYTQLNNVMKIIKLYHCTIINQDVQLFCRMNIAIAKDKSIEVIKRLTDNGMIELEKTEA